jgi:hypothetical protein
MLFNMGLGVGGWRRINVSGTLYLNIYRGEQLVDNGYHSSGVVL